MKSSECASITAVLRKNLPYAWSVLLEKKTRLTGDNSIGPLFEKLFVEIVEQERYRTSENISIDGLESTINSTILMNQGLDNNEIVLEMDTDVNVIRNSLIFKALTQAYKHPDFDINMEFCKHSNFLNCSEYQLIDITSSKEYKMFIEFWRQLIIRIEENFVSIINFLGPNYKLISSFHRHLKNMLNEYNIKQITINNNFKSDLNVNSQYDGPEFTSRLLNFLVNSDGNKKCIPLKHLHAYQINISHINKMMWANWILQRHEYNHTTTQFDFALESSKKIIREIEYINSICSLTREETDNYLQKIVVKLIAFSEQAPRNKTDIVYLTAVMNSLIGSLELHFSSFTALIDPVEKKKLKSKYIDEDIEHLSYMKTAYEMIQGVMKYKFLGKEITLNISNEIEKLEKKKEKYRRRSAFRPQICLYKELCEELKHFFTTNGNFCNLITIIDMVEKAYQCLDTEKENMNKLDITGIIRRLELWITNSQRFLSHTLKKYCTYYKDLTQPIESSLNTICLGFESIKQVLQQKYNAIITLKTGTYLNIESKVKEVLINILKFPIEPLNLHENTSDLFQYILENTDSSSTLYFILLKAKIKEIRNTTVKSKEIDNKTFTNLNYVFKMLNNIWNNEERNRKISKENHEMLYTTTYVLYLISTKFLLFYFYVKIT